MELRRWLTLGLLLLLPGGSWAAEAAPKRVLMVHSFGSSAPPFTTHSTAFEATLTQGMGQRVDLDEISLDNARYAEPDMEEAFVEFLLKRLAKWQPDLVVPIGSPAGRFVAKFRDRLFPGTPILYTGMDRRTISPDAVSMNATFVGEDFKLAGLVEDILQIAPDTDNIEVILGATPLERYWASEFRRAFERFTDRVRFNFLNDLSFDQMLDRLSRLPPRSFILLGLFLRDASGVTYNEDEALQRLHAVANAPINGLYQNQLGLGIVGGRLYQGELQGVESARIAIRILHGEPASSFPPMFVGTQRPRYDSRELQRWRISEGRLPAGSIVEFRQPTTWQRYRLWIAGIVTIVVLQAGSILLLIVNLSRRRRVERALRDSEEQVQLAADSAGAGLWNLDLASRRVWATPRLRELLRLGPGEELTFDSFLRVIHPQDREHVRESFEGPGRVAAELGLEFRIEPPGGGQRWIATRGHLAGDRKGRGLRWSGASVDVTERRLAEERLHESESRFRTVADSAPVLIWMAGVDRRRAFFNKPWLDFTGRTEAQEMGDGWTGGLHPDDRPGYLHAYTHAFDARRPFEVQYRLRRHDGEDRWILDTGVPLHDAQGVFGGYIGSCSDITERLRAEAETHDLRQELAHISRVATVGEMTAAIVHELGQPLAAMRTNAQAGLRVLAAGRSDGDAMRELLEDIVADNRRADQVVEHLRSLFKKGEVERRPLHLNDLIKDVVSVVLSDAGRRHVSIVPDLAGDLPEVSGDRVQLQQVLLNLLMNAFEAMDVTEGPRRVVVRTRALADLRVQVDVTDSGPGIPDEKLHTIFKAFVTTKPRGMGVGLSVSHSIVQAHEGSLWADNDPEGGAAFHIVLPAITNGTGE